MDHRGSTARIRIAAIAAAVSLAALVFAPTAAFAATKAATKIVVSKSSVTVDWGTPGVTPATPTVGVKLYKKSGTKWVALKGKVTMTFQSDSTGAWAGALAKTGSSLSFSLPARGRYRFVYAGNSTTKPATSYTKRVDLIGESITPLGVSRADVDETWTQVTASYAVTWNVEAFHPDADSRALAFSFYGTFDNQSLIEPLYSGDVSFYQALWQPGTIWISYRIRTEDIPTVGDVKFYNDCTVESESPYIETSLDSEYEAYVTPMYVK